MPTPNTSELLRVVTKLAVGPPLVAFPVPLAPTAPAPFVPEISTPVKLTTVIVETGAEMEKFAVTETLDNPEDANALQISDVPNCTFVRPTRTQVNPPPVTLLTTVFEPLPGLSAPTKASSNSFPEAVEKEGLVMLVLAAGLSLNTVASIMSVPGATAVDVKLTLATLALLTETF